MMGASDIRENIVPAVQPYDAGELAEDIARLNKEWRQKRDSFRNSQQSIEASANLLTPEAVGSAPRPSLPAPAVTARRGLQAAEATAASDNGLAEAAACGSMEDCRRILSRGGAEVANAWGSDGTTPLCAAANWDNADVVRLLLEVAADPRQPNQSGLQPTPLHVAALQENGKICMLLLDARADPHGRDRAGVTPSDYASCSEAVWPIFAANGCLRTTKEELMRQGVIRKASPSLELELEVAQYSTGATDSDSKDVDGQTTSGVLREFSRPGSAYVLTSKHPPRPGSAAMGNRPGSNSRSGRRPSGNPIDILAEGDEAAEAATKGNMAGYTAGIPRLPPSSKNLPGKTVAPGSLRSLGL